MAVNTQRHLVRIITARVGPAGEEPPLFVDGLPVQAYRRHGRAVNVAEVGAVGSVRRAPRKLRIRPVVAGGVGFELRKFTEEVGQLPLRLLAAWLMPHEYAVALLAYGVHPKSQCAVGPVRLIGDVAVGAVGSPAPPVKRALDAVADHLATVADVGAEVLAVRFQDVRFTGIVTIGDEVLTEVPQRPHLAGTELRRPADHEPAGDLPGERHLHAPASSVVEMDTKEITV